MAEDGRQGRAKSVRSTRFFPPTPQKMAEKMLSLEE
jgi:hypothetical protein